MSLLELDYYSSKLTNDLLPINPYVNINILTLGEKVLRTYEAAAKILPAMAITRQLNLLDMALTMGPEKYRKCKQYVTNYYQSWCFGMTVKMVS